MNYATPYTPNYGAPASYDQYAAAQQYAAALDQYNAQQYPMVHTGQAFAVPGGFGAAPPNLTPLQAAWWQQPTFGMPRWTIAAGAAALTGIFLAHQAGVFGKMGGSRSSSRTTTRRSTARDASSDMSRRKPKRRRAGSSRRRRR